MKKFLIINLALFYLMTNAQETIRYTGSTLVNVDYHHGQLTPAVGVHNIQVFRANREHPQDAEGCGWTYNHAPMLAYWNSTFYLEYLSDSIGESIPPGQTLLLTSNDGYNWSKPLIVFPKYKIPDGTMKEGHPEKALDLYAVMHQRMGFYVSKSNRLLVLGYYGICFNAKDDPNDGKGIGRVVREVYKNGKFGNIYFIRYNSAWNTKNTSFPFYTSSKDKEFVKACNELMASPLMMQQWNEESDRNDTLIPLKKEYKAFSYYHLPDGRIVGLWKNALTSISKDGGKTWPAPVRAPKFVNGSAKIWGQKTSDGNFATVYNPSEFRWPLAISVSKNGLDYENLLLIQGEIPPMRYGGNYKSYGPQYVRGIIEGNGMPPDSNMWVTYSMNKEDIWVARIPVPVKDKADEHINDVFGQMKPGNELNLWNIHGPLWATVKIANSPEGKRAIELKDSDKFDYAKAERIFPSGKNITVEFSVLPLQCNKGKFNIELQDSKGTAAIRLIFDSDSTIKVKSGARFSNMMKYKAGETYYISISANTETRFYSINVNGKDLPLRLFFAPVAELSRIVFRTGDVSHFPDADTPADQTYDLTGAGEPDEKVVYYIEYLKTFEK